MMSDDLQNVKNVQLEKPLVVFILNFENFSE